MNVDLRCGDSFDLLKTLSDNSVDTVITDPPAGISFMGKDWDGDKGGRDAWIVWLSAILSECYRVAKPGAMLLCWALPRTSHWTGTAIENAGWEVRDVISHLFGSGFPKSLDISKALDKQAGAEREVIGNKGLLHGRHTENHSHPNGDATNFRTGWDSDITAPATPAAREWDGYGTALKPACEFWWLAMKPLDKGCGFAQNALKWGVAGLNVDAGRILAGDDHVKNCRRNGVSGIWEKHTGEGINTEAHPQGRFPSHVVLSHSPNCNGSCADDCPVKLLDEQSGERGLSKGGSRGNSQFFGIGEVKEPQGYGDTGGASRFFYVAKASRRERDAGLEGMPEQVVKIGAEGHKINPMTGREVIDPPRRNTHPTVKPVTLLEYLCNLTRTPTGGVVLDPFMGSGSTIVAAIRTGRSVIGFEAKPEYYEIAVARARHAQQGQPTLL